MSFDRFPYDCPICGKTCHGAIAFRKHYNSCNNKQQKKKEKQWKEFITRLNSKLGIK